MCEYGNAIFMGASALHLHKLDAVQKVAENCVRQHFNPCYLVARPVPLVCCASSWIPIIASYSRFSAHPCLCYASPPSAI